jgi:hypothetical protein
LKIPFSCPPNKRIFQKLPEDSLFSLGKHCALRKLKIENFSISKKYYSTFSHLATI